MLKKFLIAVIVAVLMLSRQIAVAAADNYDWSKAPRLGNIVEFARYIENERRAGQTTFRVVLTSKSILPNVWSSMTLDKNDLVRIVPCRDFDAIDAYIEDSEMRLSFGVVEYPGTRVANAYLSENKTQAWRTLTDEEQKLYNIAVDIVNEANKCPSEREKALYIHNAICGRMKEYVAKNERNKTAIGALVDGYAQCQGFSDAFYMLGRMSGLNVGRLFGEADGIAHVWNWITFEDGKSYCVDVTNDFVNKFDVLFCVDRKTLENDVHFTDKGNSHTEKTGFWCEWDIIPNMQ